MERSTAPSSSSSSANDDESTPPSRTKWTRIYFVKIWVMCSAVRLLNTALIHSYFDPDEYWQTLEPSYCLAFPNHSTRTGQEEDRASSPYLTCPGFTWEWKRRAPTATTGAPVAEDASSSSSYSSHKNVTSYLYATIVEPSLQGPARSHVPMLPTYLLYRFLQYWKWDSSWAVSRAPMLLNAVWVASIVDVTVLYVATVLYDSAAPIVARCCLLASLMSWFNAYSLVRTYSNSQETALLMVSIALVAPDLLQDDGFSSTPSHDKHLTRRRFSVGLWGRHCWAFYWGGIATAIRFTALAAWVPMGILLAIRYATEGSTTVPQPGGRKRRRRLVRFVSYLLNPCAIFGLLGIFTTLVVDRIMYGFWTVPFLGLVHFNVVQNFAELYGSHPWHWYLTAGLPAITGLLLVPLIVSSLPRLLLRNSTHRGVRNLWIIVITYVLIMSFNSHKEFRYIHPVLPLVCLLTGPDLHRWAAGTTTASHRTTNEDKASRLSRWWRTWGRKATVLTAFGLANLFPVLYLGLFHQSGPITVQRSIVDVARQHATSIDAEDGGRSNESPATARYRVYYWTGECHSTPLHSHLHHPRNPPIGFDTWSLDCSPSCRSDPDLLACETKQFQSDPDAFVRRALCLDGDGSTINATRPECRHFPHFVVTFSSYAKQLDPVLQQHLGMHVVGRYPLHLTGVALTVPWISTQHDSRCWHFGGRDEGDLCKDYGERTRRRSRRRVLGSNTRDDSMGRRQRGFAVDVETEDVVLYSRGPILRLRQEPAVDGTCDA